MSMNEQTQLFLNATNLLTDIIPIISLWGKVVKKEEEAKRGNVKVTVVGLVPTSVEELSSSSCDDETITTTASTSTVTMSSSIASLGAETVDFTESDHAFGNANGENAENPTVHASIRETEKQEDETTAIVKEEEEHYEGDDPCAAFFLCDDDDNSFSTSGMGVIEEEEDFLIDMQEWDDFLDMDCDITTSATVTMDEPATPLSSSSCDNSVFVSRIESPAEGILIELTESDDVDSDEEEEEEEQQQQQQQQQPTSLHGTANGTSSGNHATANGNVANGEVFYTSPDAWTSPNAYSFVAPNGKTVVYTMESTPDMLLKCYQYLALSREEQLERVHPKESMPTEMRKNYENTLEKTDRELTNDVLDEMIDAEVKAIRRQRRKRVADALVGFLQFAMVAFLAFGGIMGEWPWQGQVYSGAINFFYMRHHLAKLNWKPVRKYLWSATKFAYQASMNVSIMPPLYQWEVPDSTSVPCTTLSIYYERALP